MTFFRRCFTCLVLCTVTTMAFADGPAANPAPPTTAPLANAASTNAPTATPPAPAPAPAPVASGLTLDAYMKDLTAELKLSDAEKQQIQSYYVVDGAQMQKILNDDTLSPLQQAQQVSDLRDARNTKIRDLLNDLDRKHAFDEIEAKYRVALTYLAADGQLIAAAPAPPAAAK